MSRSTLSLIVVIGILAALSSWLSRERVEDGLLASRAPAHIPDYYIAGFSAAAYTAEGVPRHRLSAENMTHFVDDRSTHLAQPHLSFLNEQGETWQLDAGRGQLDAAGETLLLTETVNLRRAGDTTDIIELRTRELTIHPSQQTATTRTPITITGPGTRVEAAGLDANFSDERLVLYSVRGRYEP
jgi:lipopolysaccharide export system protein LptC